jgi:hypothetical protein
MGKAFALSTAENPTTKDDKMEAEVDAKTRRVECDDTTFSDWCLLGCDSAKRYDFEWTRDDFSDETSELIVNAVDG